MRIADFIIFGSLTFIFSLYIVQGYVQTYYNPYGVRVVEYQKSIDELKLENDLLRQEILKLSSLQTIHQEAEELGYRDPVEKDYLYLK